MTDVFAAYAHAIMALTLVGLMGLVMAPIVGRHKVVLGMAPGSDPAPDYESAVYRWHRAYQNLSETMGYFVAVTLAAILAGATPFWVNLLASLFVLARVVMIVVHVRGIGRADMSLRSLAFGVGLICCMLLALLAILEVF